MENPSEKRCNDNLSSKQRHEYYHLKKRQGELISIFYNIHCKVIYMSL